MTKIYDYSKIDVRLMAATPNAMALLDIAMNVTMSKDYEPRDTDMESRCRRLIEMGHTSLFEHINYTFMIEGASRNFLAQMTRHRIASYTSGSQHYQLYGDYDFNIGAGLADDMRVEHYINEGVLLYNMLLEEGRPREEARQILPGGMQNNLMVTMNARSLMNFFNLRLCRRNVAEMQKVAKDMYKLCYAHAPYIWSSIGPDCLRGRCRQGKMGCGKGKMTIDELVEVDEDESI